MQQVHLWFRFVCRPKMAGEFQNKGAHDDSNPCASICDNTSNSTQSREFLLLHDYGNTDLLLQLRYSRN